LFLPIFFRSKCSVSLGISVRLLIVVLLFAKRNHQVRKINVSTIAEQEGYAGDVLFDFKK